MWRYRLPVRQGSWENAAAGARRSSRKARQFIAVPFSKDAWVRWVQGSLPVIYEGTATVAGKKCRTLYVRSMLDGDPD
jgi:hypothetical protein